MRPVQQARRLINRFRRLFRRDVDNEPLVVHEGGPSAEPRASRLARWARGGLGFLITFAVLALLYGVSVAWRERVVLPLDPAAAPAPASGSRAIGAAAGLLSLDSLDFEREAWFAPAGRKARFAAFQLGAAEAVAAFVEVVERRRPGRDKDLALAAAALIEGERGLSSRRYARARDALRRFNVRAGRTEPSVDRGQHALAALARAAAAGVQSYERALLLSAEHLGVGPIAGEARANFYRARGCAYAWRLLLGAYDGDLPEPRHAPSAQALARARAALAEAAEFEPLLLASFPTKGRDPLGVLVVRLADARVALDVLAAQADKAPR